VIIVAVNPSFAEAVASYVVAASGLSDYIKCEALIDGNHICGYIALLDRALQAYMARTVGGVIGLDAEYRFNSLILFNSWNN